ncbi:MAG: hypothetical protein ACTSRY_07195 [Alphaproteobacteria bacterium]
MRCSLPTAVFATVLASAVLTAVLVRLALLLPEQPAMRWWSAAFAVNTLRYAVAVFLPEFAPAARRARHGWRRRSR